MFVLTGVFDSLEREEPAIVRMLRNAIEQIDEDEEPVEEETDDVNWYRRFPGRGGPGAPHPSGIEHPLLPHVNPVPGFDICCLSLHLFERAGC